LQACVPDLPVQLLVAVLQKVPQQQRLSQVAFTSRAWASAAMLATVDVKLQLSPASKPAFETWIQQNGAQMISIELTNCRPSDSTTLQLQLPWKNLKNLQLLDVVGVQLQLPAWSDQQPSTRSNNGPQPLLPSLRKLQLLGCGVVWRPGLEQLTKGSKLTSLRLDSGGLDGLLEWRAYRRAFRNSYAMLESMLPHLPGLAVLHLPDIDLTPTAVQHMSAITGLQVSREIPLSGRKQHMYNVHVLRHNNDQHMYNVHVL
jgi:hypothetical protein